MRTGGKIQLNKITINKCCLMETMRYRATQSVRRPFQSASRLYRTKLDLDFDNGVSIQAIVVLFVCFLGWVTWTQSTAGHVPRRKTCCLQLNYKRVCNFYIPKIVITNKWKRGEGEGVQDKSPRSVKRYML